MKPQVRFNQMLLFDDARLCELQRETLLIFEIYANLIDDTDSSAPYRDVRWHSNAINRMVFASIYLIMNKL